MIGIWGGYSNIYLIVTGVITLVLFGIPLMLVPMKWASVFRWEIPGQRNLAAFIGRSLGVMLSVVAIFAFKAAQAPAVKPFFFDFMLWIFGGMLVLHTYGAIRKIQPLTETIEILVWIGLILATICFYPV